VKLINYNLTKNRIRYRLKKMLWSEVKDYFLIPRGVKSKAYKNAALQFPSDESQVTIKSIDDCKISDHMKEKIKKILQDGIPNFINIMGIGAAKAQEFMLNNITIKDLYKEPLFSSLPIITQYYLKYKPLVVIPRSLIDNLKMDIQNKLIYSDENKKNTFEIVGSYRREKKVSKDIDIICIDMDHIKSILEQLGQLLIYSEGKEKISTLFLYKKQYVKLDLFQTTMSNWAPMLLYSTGSREFNIKMRSIAKHKDMLLNHKGLYKNSKKIKTLNEEDIFKKLNMQYLPPNMR
jgi:DNA polymerase/3'-5' exonuclease PolX